MYPKIAKAIHPTPADAGVVVVPRIPQDVVNEILDILAADSDFQSLQSCALLSKSWVQSCRRHVFRVVTFTSGNAVKWFKAFPEPEESPARHVRDLRVWIGRKVHVPDKFFEYLPWFTNVERMTFLGYGSAASLLRPSLWRLTQSVTSLTIDVNVFTLTQVWEIMAQLPNLDDLSLSGFRIPVREDALPEIGTPLWGRFSGRLLLRGGYSHKDVMDALLEIPSGLHFTEVNTICGRSLFSVVRLAEACGKTLMKLSQTVCLLGKPPSPGLAGSGG